MTCLTTDRQARNSLTTPELHTNISDSSARPYRPSMTQWLMRLSEIAVSHYYDAPWRQTRTCPWQDRSDARK